MTPSSAIGLRFSNDADASTKIGDELTTAGDIVTRLVDGASPFARRLSGARLRRVTWDDLTGDGYTSSLYRVELELEGDGDVAPISFILKSFSYLRMKHFIQEMLGSELSTVPPEFVISIAKKCGIVHDSECRFYKVFGGGSGHSAASKLPLIDIYAIEAVTLDEDQIPKGFLLMKDLTKTACTVKIAEGLNKVQIRTIIDVIIDFHAALIADQDETAKWREIPEASVIADDNTYVDKYSKQLESGFDKSAVIPYMRRLRRLMEKEFYIYVNNQIAKDLGLPELVCHGDLWGNNILWKRRLDGSAGNELAALIDWQLSHRGNIMGDFARILTTSCDQELRENIESWLLPYYLDKLSSAVKIHGITIDFTVEQLEKAYKFAKAHQSVSNLITIEPLHKSFLRRSPEDPEAADRQTRRLIDRAAAVLQDVVQFLSENAPEWLTD